MTSSTTPFPERVCPRCGALHARRVQPTFDVCMSVQNIEMVCRECGASGLESCSCGYMAFTIEDRQIHGGSWQRRLICGKCGRAQRDALPMARRHT